MKGRIPVIVDSGFRRGTDAVKALAMGAQAVGLGRPYLWGFGAFGQEGVERVLEIVRNETRVAMQQCGVRSVKELNTSFVRRLRVTRYQLMIWMGTSGRLILPDGLSRCDRDLFAVTRYARRATPLHLRGSASETRHAFLQRVASSEVSDGDAALTARCTVGAAEGGLTGAAGSSGSGVSTISRGVKRGGGVPARTAV